MSDPTNGPVILEGAAVTVTTKTALGKAAPWMKFLGIIGYIGVGVMALFGVGAFIFGLVFREAPFSEHFGPWFPLVGLLYLALAVVMYFPVRFLMRMAKSSKRYGATAAASDLESVAVSLRGLAKYYGILMIVVLSIYLVILLGLIVFAATFASQWFRG